MFSPNTGKYGPGKTPYLDNFHEVDNNDTSKIRWWLKSWLQNYSIISYKHYSTYKLVNNKSKSWTKQKLAHFVYIYGKWRNSIFLWKIIDILETFGLKIRSSLYRRKDLLIKTILGPWGAYLAIDRLWSSIIQMSMMAVTDKYFFCKFWIFLQNESHKLSTGKDLDTRN